VYLHVPFCQRRCDYCAFATWTDRHHLVADYLSACRLHAEQVAPQLPVVTSVFVGGGTPSMVPAEQLLAVLEPLPVTDDTEITVECNPDTVSAELLDAYRRGGVNRLSLGVQSMVPHVLAALGREHDPANVRTAVSLARAAGFGSLNLDLIYGAAGETLADWRDTLLQAIDLGPEHVSAYALTVEPGTPLAADPARHPDDDEQADKYLLADGLLVASGRANYEISNWCLAGHECRHNLLYWSQGDYVGLGCAAHSHRRGRRWWSVRTPERYIEAVTSGSSTEAGDETLGAEAADLELLQLAVRTRDGVPAGAVPSDVGHLVEPARAGRVRLTVEGRLLANEVAIRLRPVPIDTPVEGA
jgi:oxygen-independent coproporphyrinogen-3 oxidase